MKSVLLISQILLTILIKLDLFTKKTHKHCVNVCKESAVIPQPTKVKLSNFSLHTLTYKMYQIEGPTENITKGEINIEHRKLLY